MKPDDDTVSRLDPTERSFFADDDVFSTPIGQDPLVQSVVPSFVLSDTSPRDLYYLEVDYDYDYDDDWAVAAKNTWLTGRADAVTIDTGADGLPFASAAYTGVQKSFLGTREYANDRIRDLYDLKGFEIDKHFDSDDPDKVFEAIKGATRSPTPDVVDRLVSLLRGENRKIADSAAQTLGEIYFNGDVDDETMFELSTDETIPFETRNIVLKTTGKVISRKNTIFILKLFLK